MTRQKSDAQLDAEAAAPRLEQAIESLIEDHRALYRTDLSLFRLHDTSGYTTDHTMPAVSGTGAVLHIGWTGVEFAYRFLRYIDWDRGEQEEGVRPSHPGQTFPWSTAFYGQWADCRRYHPEHHGRPEWRGSLCRQLVSLTVRGTALASGEARQLTLTEACLVLGVTPQRAGRTLRVALLWIESSIDRARNRQEQRGKPVREQRIVAGIWRDRHERHGLPGLHADDCPQCRVAS